jgi:hypothetical protein
MDEYASLKASGRKLAWAGFSPSPEMRVRIISAEGKQDARHLPHSEEKAKVCVKKRLKTVPRNRHSGPFGSFVRN